MGKFKNENILIMRTDIKIYSNSFSPYENEEQEINPGRFGKRLAEFLKTELETKGIEVAEIYPTDYAYELRIEKFNFKIYVIAGNIDGEKEHFLISIEPKKKYIRKLFKKIPTEEKVSIVYETILNICKNNEYIKLG